MLGNQCLVYGLFIYALLLIPNSASARIAILLCGTLLSGTGGVLRLIGRRREIAEALEAEHLDQTHEPQSLSTGGA
jgi:hypothetical protein